MSYGDVEPRMNVLRGLVSPHEPLPPTRSRCAECDVYITWTIEPHWQGWLDDDGDMLSYAPTLHNHRAVDLVALRYYARSALMRIAAGGGPANQAEHDVVYCRVCNCNKSGHLEEPNLVTEACSDPDCACHDGSLSI